jgi:hypothetical protein
VRQRAADHGLLYDGSCRGARRSIEEPRPQAPACDDRRATFMSWIIGLRPLPGRHAARGPCGYRQRAVSSIPVSS